MTNQSTSDTGEVKSHSLEIIGYDIAKPMTGDYPASEPYKEPVYKCQDHGEIYPEKPKRGFTRSLTKKEVK